MGGYLVRFTPHPASLLAKAIIIAFATLVSHERNHRSHFQVHQLLVQTDADITPDSGSQMDLSFQVELDADEESRGLLVAVLIGGASEQLT